MEVKSISGKGSTLSLSASEEKAYRDFKEAQQFADKKDDSSLIKVAEDKFLSIVNPFLRNIGLNPKRLDWQIKGSQRAVECEEFEMGDSSYSFDKHPQNYGFKYTPIVVFGLNGSISVDRSFAQAPRFRTTLDVAKDVVGLVYHENGDGLKTPQIQMVDEGYPRVYVVSAAQLKPVLTRLQEVFKGMGNDRLAALDDLHYEAEEQDGKNKFLAGLHRRTYRNLLETVVK